MVSVAFLCGFTTSDGLILTGRAANSLLEPCLGRGRAREPLQSSLTAFHHGGRSVWRSSCGSTFMFDLLRAGASVRQSIVFNLHGAFSRGSSGGPKSPLLVRVSCNCGLPGIDAIFELAFASDRALRRGSSGGPIFALNPGGSWVDAEMSLGKDPYLDRASGPESRGRHRINPLLARL